VIHAWRRRPNERTLAHPPTYVYLRRALSSTGVRTCWLCLGTDHDDDHVDDQHHDHPHERQSGRERRWTRPCRCRGSTQWAHEDCLKRWIDTKQRGLALATATTTAATVGTLSGTCLSVYVCVCACMSVCVCVGASVCVGVMVSMCVLAGRGRFGGSRFESSKRQNHRAPRVMGEACRY
jgi:hypothetical protein